MCGRYTQVRPWSELVTLYRITTDVPPMNLPPRYNIAPTQTVPIIGQAQSPEERELAIVRWGLLPSWAKDFDAGYKMINARAESVGDKLAFRRALRESRCLIVADGFYEWRPDGRRKQPYYITLQEKGPLAFAGLWERWQNPQGHPIESCAIIVCEANTAVRPIHDRMPVILEADAFDAWLDAKAEIAATEALLNPFAGPLAAFPVSLRVNNVRTDDPHCFQPIVTRAGLVD